MHDPKYDPSYGVAYLVDPTPGRHTQNAVLLNHLPDVKGYTKSLRNNKFNRYDYFAQGTTQALVSPYLHIANALGFCFFALVTGNMPPLTEIISSVIGENYSLEEVFKTGERILTLRHLFNLREGAFPKDFKLPDRVMGTPPQKIGPLQGVTLDPESMKQGYFSTLDWNIDTGIPSRLKLDQLGLAKIWDNQLEQFFEEVESNQRVIDLQKAKEIV
jgi:aldehyde:ferredoxin oxidoreductase